MPGMKALLRLRLLHLLAVMSVSAPLSSCYTTQPQRDEPSPLAPQWAPFQHHRH